MQSVWELNQVIKNFFEMLKEALQFEPAEGTAEMVADKTLFHPLILSKKAKDDVFWELSETARQKLYEQNIFQDHPNRGYFTIKLFRRGMKRTVIERNSFVFGQNWGVAEPTPNERWQYLHAEQSKKKAWK